MNQDIHTRDQFLNIYWKYAFQLKQVVILVYFTMSRKPEIYSFGESSNITEYATNGKVRETKITFILELNFHGFPLSAANLPQCGNQSVSSSDIGETQEIQE